MHYVYLIRSQNFPEQTYVGYTTELTERIKKHNEGGSLHTQKYKPWQLIGFLGFDSQSKALKFEKHLKTNAGRIFLKRYFYNNKEIS